MFWIEKIFNYFKPKGIIMCIALSSLISILPIFIPFIPGLYIKPPLLDILTHRRAIAILTGSIWIAIGPYLIHRYITETNTFFVECQKNNPSRQIENIRIKFNNTFAKDKSFKLILILWEALVLLCVVLNDSYIRCFGIEGYSDIYFTIFCLCFSYVLYLNAVGFYGVYITIRHINFLIERKLIKIDYFTTDGHGGLGFIIQYIYKVTMIFGTGILFVPILLDFVLFNDKNIIKLCLYLMLFVYSAMLFLCFYIPWRKVNKYLLTAKNNEKANLYNQYKEKVLVSINACSMEISDYLIQTSIYNYINVIDKTDVAHINIIKYIEMFAVIIMPAISVFINIEDLRNTVTQLYNAIYIYMNL